MTEPDNEAHYGSCVEGCNRVCRRWEDRTEYSIEGAEGVMRASFPKPTHILDEVFRELERQYIAAHRPALANDKLGLLEKQIRYSYAHPPDQMSMF